MTMRKAQEKPDGMRPCNPPPAPPDRRDETIRRLREAFSNVDLLLAEWCTFRCPYQDGCNHCKIDKIRKAIHAALAGKE